MKGYLIIPMILILIVGFAFAADLIIQKKSNSQEGMNYIPKVDLNVQANGNTITINDLTITDASSSYVVNELASEKEGDRFQYIQTASKSQLTKQLSTTYSEEPNQILNNYYFDNSEDYEEYCKEFKSCLPPEDYVFQVLEYDGFYINTRRIDTTTGEIYPTTMNGNILTTKTPNSKTSVTFNDIVLNSGAIWINGNDIQWINYTRFLVDVAPECSHLNGSGVLEENMSAVITPCQLVLNHSSSIVWENASLIFDMNVIGQDTGAIRLGNLSMMNLTRFDLGFTGDIKINSLATRFMEDTFATCVPAGSLSLHPECPVMIFNNVNLNGFGTITTARFSIYNGTLTNTKFKGVSTGKGGKYSNLVFDNLQVTGGGSMAGGNYQGTNIWVETTVCFSVAFSGVKINLNGGTYKCSSKLSNVFLGGLVANITDADLINSRVITATGSIEFFEKETVNMNLRGDNSTDEVVGNITITNNNNVLKTYDTTTNFTFPIVIYEQIGAVTYDHNPFHLNVTNSSYFPTRHFEVDLSIEDVNGIWQMHEIPYSIKLNPNSDFTLIPT